METRYQKMQEETNLIGESLKAVGQDITLESLHASGRSQEGNNIHLELRLGEKELPDGRVLTYSDCIQNDTLKSRSCSLWGEEKDTLVQQYMEQDEAHIHIGRRSEGPEGKNAFVEKEYLPGFSVQYQSSQMQGRICANGFSPFEAVQHDREEDQELWERVGDHAITYLGKQPKELVELAANKGILYNREVLQGKKATLGKGEPLEGPFERKQQEIVARGEQLDAVSEESEAVVQQLLAELEQLELTKNNREINDSGLESAYKRSDLETLLQNKQEIEGKILEAKTLKARFRSHVRKMGEQPEHNR